MAEAKAPHAAPSLPSSREDTCPRCGGGFHCGAKDPGPCACSGLVLPPALQAELRAQYAGCLCVRCLAELARTTT
ncbi:cysteine-rich CWC family protein [Aquincola sp. J276]|uniref:cysteine-rich CWC family protein n=1 Tax=Aquincola sp. J276 TaxID=2898432 RepID=UPI002151BB70|nr:cysteine-rich CWC family protein [Aquincola sp. J276]MCR5865549.1 cysteine-rich CWC family protein [Aquincola sp. J276]